MKFVVSARTLILQREAVSSTGPDILISAGAANGDGYLWINKNKFGPEEETASRYKIKVLADTTNFIIPAVHITDNQFFGVDGADSH